MEQRTQEWFEARSRKLTGSNIGAALGLSPYKTPSDLIRQMVRDYHGAESEFKGNIATEYGSLHEPLALMEFMGKTGHMTEECGFFVHSEHDWLGASPDGLIGDDALVEVKCPFSARSTGVFKAAHEQPHYYAQMQMELACAGRKKAYFYQWSSKGDSLEVIEYSQEWFDGALPKLREFYDWYLSELDNPEHLEPLAVEINTQETKALLEEYDSLKETIDNAESRRKEIMIELIAASDSRNALLWGRKLTEVERKGSVQYAKIPELKGVDVEPYRAAPSKFWKLS